MKPTDNPNWFAKRFDPTARSGQWMSALMVPKVRAIDAVKKDFESLNELQTRQAAKLQAMDEEFFKKLASMFEEKSCETETEIN